MDRGVGGGGGDGGGGRALLVGGGSALIEASRRLFITVGSLATYTTVVTTVHQHQALEVPT